MTHHRQQDDQRRLRHVQEQLCAVGGSGTDYGHWGRLRSTQIGVYNRRLSRNDELICKVHMHLAFHKNGSPGAARAVRNTHQDRHRLGQDNEVMTPFLGQTYLDLGLLRLPRSVILAVQHSMQLSKKDK
jgi:hypothetical protein